MIRSFADRATEEVFNDRCPKGFPAQIFRAARRKLALVDAAARLDDPQVGARQQAPRAPERAQGQHALSINAQYRVCFTWKDGDAFDVEITDYHD